MLNGVQTYKINRIVLVCITIWDIIFLNMKVGFLMGRVQWTYTIIILYAQWKLEDVNMMQVRTFFSLFLVDHIFFFFSVGTAIRHRERNT